MRKLFYTLMCLVSSCTLQKKSSETLLSEDDPYDSGWIALILEEDEMKVLNTNLSNLAPDPTPDPTEPPTIKKGIVQCTKSNGDSNCFLNNIHIQDNNQKLKLPIGSLPDKLWKFMQSMKLESTQESDTLTIFVRCNNISSILRPFSASFFCESTLPMLPNEGMILQPAAEEIADKIQGNSHYEGKISKPRGTILCQIQPASCTMRAVEGGTLKDTILTVSSDNSAKAAKTLLDTLQNYTQLAAKGKTQKFLPPTEIMASILCFVDNTFYQKLGKRHYQCLFKL